MTDPDLRDARPDDADVTALLRQLHADIEARYGDEPPTTTPVIDFTPPRGRFLVVDVGGTAVAMGGIRRLAEDTCELKRCYVVPVHRRRGHSRRLLAALEDAARELGYRQLRLATGALQPEALALYTSAGYRPIAPYGPFADSPLTRCFEREL